jgi:hypothetical protein
MGGKKTFVVGVKLKGGAQRYAAVGWELHKDYILIECCDGQRVRLGRDWYEWLGATEVKV